MGLEWSGLFESFDREEHLTVLKACRREMWTPTEVPELRDLRLAAANEGRLLLHRSHEAQVWDVSAHGKLVGSESIELAEGLVDVAALSRVYVAVRLSSPDTKVPRIHLYKKGATDWEARGALEEPERGTLFGYDIAVDEEWMVVGAPGTLTGDSIAAHDSVVGALHTYRWRGVGWAEAQQFTWSWDEMAPDAIRGPRSLRFRPRNMPWFGRVVRIANRGGTSWLAVGAPGYGDPKYGQPEYLGRVCLGELTENVALRCFSADEL